MKLKMFAVFLFVSFVNLIEFGQVAGVSISGPNPWIDVTYYGAKGDANISSQHGITCTINSTTTDLMCTGATFTAADIGKFVEIPTAGAASATPPAPIATLLTRINAFVSSVEVTVQDSAMHTATGVPITWGTDNSTPVQLAMDTCPTRGCVLYFPAGDYMFGSNVAMPTQTSFEIRGQGNSGKKEQSFEAGVRLLTAMPITIMTLGPIGVGVSNAAGFQLWNLAFVDTSSNGSAKGGLLIQQTSEALIAECDFEAFNGKQLDGPVGSPLAKLSYGMKADPGSDFNNNLVLLHDKGKDNSVWYDASLPNQDGPIVLGGDIFPINTQSSGECYGITISGPIRVFGTHFDVGSDPSTPPTLCTAIRTNGGQIVGKFESSAANRGNGVELVGGGTNIITFSSLICHQGVVNAPSATNSLEVGQIVTISGAGTMWNGSFVVRGATSTSFAYDDPSCPDGMSTSAGSAKGAVTQAVEVNALFNNLASAVIINPGATNNKITALVAQTNGTDVDDNGSDDDIEIMSAGGNIRRLSSSPSPTGFGTFDLGTTALPWGNLFLSGSSSTNRFEITGSPIVNRTLTLPDANDTLVGETTMDTFTNKTLDTAGSGNHIQIGGHDIPSAVGSAYQVLRTNSGATGVEWGQGPNFYMEGHCGGMAGNLNATEYLLQPFISSAANCQSTTPETPKEPLKNSPIHRLSV